MAVASGSTAGKFFDYQVISLWGCRLDFRCGSKPEVQRGSRNVSCWGKSRPQFRAAEGLLLAITGSQASRFQHPGISLKLPILPHFS